MQDYRVTSTEAGYQLRKLLSRILDLAPDSFLYKMLRKKNITLNGRKADGREKLAEGDVIRLYLSDETIGKFSRKKEEKKGEQAAGTGPSLRPEQILYENEDVLVLNKPAGMLTQKGKAADDSLNDRMLAYLKTGEDRRIYFRPSVCNRLDRNTSGIVLAGKTPAGLRTLSDWIRGDRLRKIYTAAAVGNCFLEGPYENLLLRDREKNRVRILPLPDRNSGNKTVPGEAVRILTVYHRLHYSEELNVTVLSAELHTGKTHQIRAQLSYLGYPVAGDPKYGDSGANRRLRLRRQMLHATSVIFPDDAPWPDLSGRKIEAPLPAEFRQFLDTE